MRVAVDVNPLAGPRTGVGTYLQNLLHEVPELPDPPELVGVQLSLRSRTLRLDGIPVRRIPLPAAALQSWWKRVPFPPVSMVTGRIDVMHGPNFVAPPAGRAATVITVHDLTYLRFPELVSAHSLRYTYLVPAALRRGAVVLTPSVTVAEEVREAYPIEPERVRPTLLGVYPLWGAAPEASAQLPAELERDYLLFVGSREPRKNLPWLLEAYRQANRGSTSVPQLVLVGPPGWGEQSQPDPAARRPVVLGYRAGTELQALVAGARAVVCPSRYEGFGLTPLEALAAGTPVIASDIPVHHEVLGDCAQFVPLNDIAALAAALTDPPPRSAEHAARGRARAAGFTWARTAADTVAGYRFAVESQ